MNNKSLDAVGRTVYSEILSAVCAEMSQVLMMSAYSPNIKERRDFSTALFDWEGEMVAQGTNIPVHLGSMPMSVASALSEHELFPGDVVILNDPYRGGTHLPDITLVTPYYLEGDPGRAEGKPLMYLANRAHHADVGGMSGGSLPLSREIYQEGLIIPPVKLVRRGEVDGGILEIVASNSRTPGERRGDVMAGLASLYRGKERLGEIIKSGGGGGSAAKKWNEIFADLKDYTEDAVKALLQELPTGKANAEDVLELEGGDLATIAVEIRLDGERMVVDFSASDPQHDGPLNAVRAIALSAVFYVVRCLLPPEVPTNAGLMRKVEVITKPGTVVDAMPPAAVAGGNVETSQRIVDVLLKALSKLLPERIPASSQGTMNNIAISGIDPRTGKAFAYYETIGGGHGGHPGGHGLSGRHSHMTNSLNTPIEALEQAYPLRVWRYEVRRGSGGAGRHRGGDGLVREIEFLADADLSVLSQRREVAPPGALGGVPGKKSVFIFECCETPRRRRVRKRIPALAHLRVKRGDRLIIETPGGGGWGAVVE